MYAREKTLSRGFSGDAAFFFGATRWVALYLVAMASNPLTDREVLVQTLKSCRWVISEAARVLGVSRQAIYDAMARFEIKRRPLSKALIRELNARAGRAGGRGNRRQAAA
jgi:hypothetical protein